jgi:hypothetical protein
MDPFDVAPSLSDQLGNIFRELMHSIIARVIPTFRSFEKALNAI